MQACGPFCPARGRAKWQQSQIFQTIEPFELAQPSTLLQAKKLQSAEIGAPGTRKIVPKIVQSPQEL
jgi:hypothetical protein